MGGVQLSPKLDVEAAAAEAFKHVDEQEWNLAEIERLQEEQVPLSPCFLFLFPFAVA